MNFDTKTTKRVMLITAMIFFPFVGFYFLVKSRLSKVVTGERVGHLQQRLFAFPLFILCWIWCDYFGATKTNVGFSKDQLGDWYLYLLLIAFIVFIGATILYYIAKRQQLVKETHGE